MRSSKSDSPSSKQLIFSMPVRKGLRYSLFLASRVARAARVFQAHQESRVGCSSGLRISWWIIFPAGKGPCAAKATTLRYGAGWWILRGPNWGAPPEERRRKIFPTCLTRAIQIQATTVGNTLMNAQATRSVVSCDFRHPICTITRLLPFIWKFLCSPLGLWLKLSKVPLIDEQHKRIHKLSRDLIHLQGQSVLKFYLLI